MNELLDLFTSGVAGSVVGGLFGWLNRKEDNKAAVNQMTLQIELLKAQTASKVEELEANAFNESQKTLSKVSDTIKSAVRPLITGALLYQTLHIHANLESLVGGLEALPQDTIIGLYSRVINDTVALTTMAVAWWFASRASYSKTK